MQLTLCQRKDHPCRTRRTHQSRPPQPLVMTLLPAWEAVHQAYTRPSSEKCWEYSTAFKKAAAQCFTAVHWVLILSMSSSSGRKQLFPFLSCNVHQKSATSVPVSSEALFLCGAFAVCSAWKMFPLCFFSANNLEVIPPDFNSGL